MSDDPATSPADAGEPTLPAAEASPAAQPADPPAALPPAAPAAAAPKRRFPWVPVLATLAGLQLIGIGVLTVLLVAAGATVIEQDNTLTEVTTTLQELTDTLEDVAAERDDANQQLVAVSGQAETAIDFATVYEECLAPLFGAYDAYEADDSARGDRLFEQAWAEDGPCWIAEAYLNE